MHPTKALLISLLPALSVATSYRRKSTQNAMLDSSLQSTNHNAGNADGVNDCGDSSFIGVTQNPENNPTVQDCQDMLTLPEVANDNEWTVTNEDTIIVKYKTCAFGVKTSAGTSPDLTAKIGNADVIDLVHTSIEKYGQGETVGCYGGYNMYVAAAGAMPCDSPDLPSGKQVGVDWTLTHS